MNKWLTFRLVNVDAAIFDAALATFKRTVPSTSRRWDVANKYWVFDPSYAPAVAAIQVVEVEVGADIALEEDDRRHGRVSATDDEALDTDLIDMQYGDHDALERLLDQVEEE